jgi:hypothetical protein
VPPDKTFAALIRRRYPATLNLGIAGDGPLLMLATLTELLPRLEPKVVLWFYFEGNDLTDLQTERRNALLTRYLKAGYTQSALARQDDIDRAILGEMPRLRAIEQTNRMKRHHNTVARAVDFMRLAALRQRLGLVGGMDANASEMADLQGDNMDIFREVLLDAEARVHAWGGQLVFVYLPDWTRYTRDSSPGETQRDHVLDLVQTLGIRVIDIDRAFQAHGDPWSLFPFRRPGHYNEIGHQLVADAVLNALSNRQ